MSFIFEPSLAKLRVCQLGRLSAIRKKDPFPLQVVYKLPNNISQNFEIIIITTQRKVWNIYQGKNFIKGPYMPC